MRSLISRALILFAAGTLATACASSGDSEKTKKMGTGENQQKGGDALTMNSWCSPVQDQQGNIFQQRIHLTKEGGITITYFRLNEDSSRGESLGEAKGKWEINGEQVTTVIDGETSEVMIRLDPQGPAGAPQLHIQDEDGTTTLDVCA